MPKVTALVSRFTNRSSLVQGHCYEVIGIENGCYRVIDESEQPTLYPEVFFLEEGIVPPSGWTYRDFGEGEYLYSPPELAAEGFYEDHADGRDDAITAFARYARQCRNISG